VDAKIDGQTIAVTIANDGWARLARPRNLALRYDGKMVVFEGQTLDQIGAGEQLTFTAQLGDMAKTNEFCLAAPDPNESLKSDARYAIRFANADSTTRKWRDGAFCFSLK
jgi:hypothetical protein